MNPVPQLPVDEAHNAAHRAFFALLAAACANVAALYGHQWRHDQSLYTPGRISKPLARFQTQPFEGVGGRQGWHQMPRDMAIPLARFWPGGTIPKGVTLDSHSPLEAPFSLVPLDHPAMFGRALRDPLDPYGTVFGEWCHVPASHPARSGKPATPTPAPTPAPARRPRLVRQPATDFAAFGFSIAA